MEQLVVFLSDQERERAARYKHSRPRDQFIFGRALLRHLLGQIVEVDPAQLAFNYDAAGKPELQGVPGIHFNLSHSDDLVAICIAPDRPVGVDVECLGHQVNVDAISQQLFDADELADLRRMAPHDRLDKFYELWTRKEALIKCLGMGWSEYLAASPSQRALFQREFSTESFRMATQAWVAISSAGGWQLRFPSNH